MYASEGKCLMNKRLERILSQNNPIGKEILDQITILESGEPLIEIGRVVPGISIRMSNARLKFAGDNVLYARETVCRMLIKAAKILSYKYNLVIFDAYRPLAYQRMRYDQIYESYKALSSKISDDEIKEKVDLVVSTPSENPNMPPAHSTGGAVDLSIVDTNGYLIDMGSEYGIYNQEQNRNHSTNSVLITSKQRENRIRLITAMVEAGFCNYPLEWWHFMYGDREYAAYEGLKTAIYGRADLVFNEIPKTQKIK